MEAVRGRPGELDLAVVGHVNLDRFLLARHLPRPDRTEPLTRQSLRLGGTATNIARAAARAGVRTALISAVGEDFPSEFREILERERVDLKGLRRLDGHSSTCFIVENGRGGQMTLIDQGPFADERKYRFPRGTLRRARFAHLTTGPPAAILELAGTSDGTTRLGVDPAQEIHYRWEPRSFRKLLEPAEILFGNRAELHAACRLAGCGSPRGLLERVPLVVGTLGRAGAVAYSRAGVVRVPGRRARRIRQVTGAGDAFRGGFYAGWVRGRPLARCLASGVASATRWIEGAGSLGDGSGAAGPGGAR